jgi:parvulin-like peptidyl-prolyl isomerase
MSFRNRPVLDRKHRPRWQDELRTQQLVVAGFALAIAVAVGIFAAAAWSAFYEGNLRQAALIDGTPVARAELEQRIEIVASELQATAVDLQAHAGGARDDIVQQQLQAIDGAFGNVQQVGTDSLVLGMVLDRRAAELGGQPTAAEVQAEIEERRTLPERKQLSLIMSLPEKDEGAEPGDEPTDQDWADAKAEIEAIKAELDGGADFAELATNRSDDPSAQKAGLLGWVEEIDGQFGQYFTAAGDAEAGEVVGPLKNDTGWYLVKVDDRQAAGRDEVLDAILAENGVTDDVYGEYVRQELLRQGVQEYFAASIVKSFQPQRRVAQIFITADTGVPVPKQRIRHLLVQPLPGAEDQSGATAAQWRAARREAAELRERALEPDADWWKLAEESDDSGSASRGGYLGWYDPISLGDQFVPEFATAVASLQIGEISELVRSEFGYHIIQITDRRTSAQELAARLAAEIRDDPDSFADIAVDQSEDVTSAKKGGDLGWVIHYQFDAARDKAIFDLTETGQISDPVVTANGIYIYKLLDTAENRFVTQSKRNSVGTSGFNRWLDELKGEAGIWLDAEFTQSTTAA